MIPKLGQVKFKIFPIKICLGRIKSALPQSLNRSLVVLRVQIMHDLQIGITGFSENIDLILVVVFGFESQELPGGFTDLLVPILPFTQERETFATTDFLEEV
jgi:hypothetical protein